MSNVTALARDWLDAKAAETKATAQRHKVEAQLAQALEVKDEGAITHQIEGYKITLTQPVSRKLDERAWALVKDGCPEALRPVKLKLEADATGVKWLAANEPAIWRKIASAFETKPGKVGVKVEEVKDGN
jgi:gamma-glutamyl:cysteine ligase YbdK (ATP-grasp superfamily)